MAPRLKHELILGRVWLRNPDSFAADLLLKFSGNGFARVARAVMRSRCCAVSTRREGESGGRQLKQLTSQPVDHAGVVARFVLPEQANRRVPGAVVTTEQPAIIRRPRQKNPCRAPKCCGEMGDA